MSVKEVQESVKIFYDHIKSQISEIGSLTRDNAIRSADDINTHIRKSYNLNIPPSVMSIIIDAITSGKLKPEATYTLICSSIDTVKEKCSSWKNSKNHDFYASYSKDPSHIDAGDVVVRKKNTSTGDLYEAYRMIDDKSSKFLGTESNFNSIKDRVEQYVTFMHVRQKINETIELSNQKFSVVKEPQMVSYGIDI
jgi:hypothetical protein